jgi:hypothetical protein
MSDGPALESGLIKPLEIHAVEPPAVEERVNRSAAFAEPGERKTRYHLPSVLDSPSPVGYRNRLPLTREETKDTLRLLSLERPKAFVTGEPVKESELFEESSLAILTSRQSTNFRGHKQVTFGPDDSPKVAELLRQLDASGTRVLDGAAYTHVVFSRPYRTPFTMLLTLAGHKPFLNLLTVPMRILRKRYQHIDDIPTIGFLQHLHLGILADAFERAAAIASEGKRRAMVHLAPFCGENAKKNKAALRKLADLAGLKRKERARGWRVAMVVQVGSVEDDAVSAIPSATFRKIGANILSFRSERIQPGVNCEEKAPDPYQARQNMNVSEAFTEMAGRAAYNAFTHWTGCSREGGKEMLLLDRVDVLTPNGKERLRSMRRELGGITDDLIKNMPLWADLPTGRVFSRNAKRGRKAFALVGQRIYIAGLSRQHVTAAGIDWILAVSAVGAAAARSALYCELMGCVDLPPECDLLAGICMMAGPVNQNDIGKQFYGYKDLLSETYSDRAPTSLLVWTLKAKTVADPIGNEEQLQNVQRKGALVDLRCGPHEIIKVAKDGAFVPMRREGDRVNTERAYGCQGNFVTNAEGQDIPGNRGSDWPEALRHESVW